MLVILLLSQAIIAFYYLSISLVSWNLVVNIYRRSPIRVMHILFHISLFVSDTASTMRKAYPLFIYSEWSRGTYR
jgi:hypothetical protein